ncbi:DUF4249 family protein [Balneolales bacterium ANBcel1]|nr:DUF4249 family protein [Balneolales bacterium ANBcel1]
MPYSERTHKDPSLHTNPARPRTTPGTGSGVFLLFWLMAFAAVSLVPAGCELYRQDDYEEQFVVESYLIAGEPLPEVRLSITAPFDESYYFEERAVGDADITISWYDEGGQRRSSFRYIEQERGIYIPAEPDRATEVEPRHMYRLEADVPLASGTLHRIEAETVIPDTFSVMEVVRNRAVYQDPEQLEFRITRNRQAGRQNHYIYSTESLEPYEENLTPFWDDITDDLDDAIRIRTGIVNEENFDINPDGTLTLRMPWIGIAFYGQNIISTFSIDNNTYDFFRSQPVQAGGGAGSISPGEIQNIIYHVDGGIGLFGGMSKLDILVTVDRPPSPQP